MGWFAEKEGKPGMKVMADSHSIGDFSQMVRIRVFCFPRLLSVFFSVSGHFGPAAINIRLLGMRRESRKSKSNIISVHPVLVTLEAT